MNFNYPLRTFYTQLNVLYLALQLFSLFLTLPELTAQIKTVFM